jgi:pyrimidine operon attenuation protein / uracil phosphoribosyltransferase
MIETAPNCIMNNIVAQEKLYRMSLQVLEDAVNDKELVLIGLNQRGFFIAEKLHEFLKLEFKGTMQIEQLQINNNLKLTEQETPKFNVQNKQVVIIDDVANTGLSFAMAMYLLLPQQPNCIKTLTLVERSHKLYPIKINYKGLAIATTLQNHIEVRINNKQIQAILR